MLRRYRLDSVERERELKIERLFGPERAVIVEGGNPLGTGTKSGAPCAVTRANKVDDGFFDCAVVPGRQRIGLGDRTWHMEKQESQRQKIK